MSKLERHIWRNIIKHYGQISIWSELLAIAFAVIAGGFFIATLILFSV